MTNMPIATSLNIVLVEPEIPPNTGSIARLCGATNSHLHLIHPLGFSTDDRTENIRRIGQVAALFSAAGVITIVSFISPYIKGRQAARKAVAEDRFIEVHLDVPIDECEKRDPKGLYKKARAGEIADFTGIDAPYEAPGNSELVLQTHELSAQQCADKIFEELVTRKLISNS